MCETDKKGLTELSEINLVRPFFCLLYTSQAYTWVNLRWFGDKKSKKTKFPAVVLTDVGFLPEKSGDFPTCFRDDFSGSAAISESQLFP